MLHPARRATVTQCALPGGFNAAGHAWPLSLRTSNRAAGTPIAKILDTSGFEAPPGKAVLKDKSLI
jgi:hypothetical protein